MEISNKSEPNVESFKQALTCPICQDIVTLPVHATCCETAKSMAPACLKCVRTYYELNKPYHERLFYRKAWGGCGCDINLHKKPINNYYIHTTQLDILRNLMGPSICHNENCGAICETSAELRRHLSGNSTANDKHGNCKEALTKCKFCNTFDKRKIIEGSHYEKYHLTIICDICNTRVVGCNIRLHYNNHKIQMSKLREKVHNYESKI